MVGNASGGSGGGKGVQCRSLVAPPRRWYWHRRTQTVKGEKRKKKVKNVYNNKIILILYYI